MTWMTVWMFLINTSFWFVCCFGMAWIVRAVPKSLYNQSRWFFKEKFFERCLYKKINIASWKDKLPEWGKFLNFEKKNLKKELSIEYIDKFILETYYAEIGHLGIAVFGFACILVNPSSYALMALIFAIVNFLIQIPFILIQRYNRPRLIRLRLKYKRT